MTQLHETREAWLTAFMNATRPHFAAAGAPLPDKIRMAVGFTSKGARGKRIGECWSDMCSGDSTFEIFIVPSIDDAARIADILTHELVHAAVGLAAKHGPAFKRVATALGLEGKMTATVAGEAWYTWALPILKELGPLPHAALTGGESTTRKKQKTALLKVECDECGWLARVTLKHIEPYDVLLCPTPDCDGKLQVEGE